MVTTRRFDQYALTVIRRMLKMAELLLCVLSLNQELIKIYIEQPSCGGFSLLCSVVSQKILPENNENAFRFIVFILMWNYALS